MQRATKTKTEQRLASLTQRDQAVRSQLEQEQKERAKKTARLRALRLAKETADKEAAEQLAAELAELKAALPIKEARRAKPKRAAKVQAKPQAAQ